MKFLWELIAVMQFGGQHPGGIGVPAVGMAFPGYVNNPGSGNSEMTWYFFCLLECSNYSKNQII